MKKFKFKLETLLNIKIQEEDLKRIELAAEIERLNREIAKMDLLVREKNEKIDDYKRLLNLSITASKIKEYNYYILKLNQKIEEQGLYIKIVEENVDKIRSELIEISRERKILEKLRAKKLDAYRKELAREEQKVIDEIVSYRYNPGLTG
ncbi:MAG: flagellar export protein FliJ [Clostridiaceae bacterium]|nr:flagellar export protein FliJ [Clostridiaceae bacterium]